MSIVYVISHPEIVVDPAKPVPRWHLSERGVARLRGFIASAVLGDVTAVWSSDETKAIEAAGLIAARYGLGVDIHTGLGENDRSATGFLPPAEFDAVANQFFAQPEESIRGWERAVDAQDRIAAAIDDILAEYDEDGIDGNIAIITHGGVGTLLLCKLLDRPIARDLDQPFQGHFWAFDRDSRQVLHHWQAI